MPSNAYDAKGLLTAAIRDDNPVIFVSNKLCMQSSCEVPVEPFTEPLSKARIVREVKDIKLIATGRMVADAESAAGVLARSGIDAEVIDPRTLSPLDFESILASVKKTSRAVVAHEAVQNCGIGAEIAARISDEAFDFLDAPVKRVGAPFSPVPFAPVLEATYLPTDQNILDAVAEIFTDRVAR